MKRSIALMMMMAAACGGATHPDIADIRTVGAPEVVGAELDPNATPGVVDTDGTYAMSSALDVEAQTLFPASAYDAMLLLEGLRDHPAETLFDLAEDAGVPAVGTIRDALPGRVER